MKIHLILLAELFLIGSISFTGCRFTSTIIPLSLDVQEGTINKTPIPAREVKIFRSTQLDSSLYKPVGMMVISNTDNDVDLSYIYDLMRKEAAKRGAEYIIDFTVKLKKWSVSITNDDGETEWEDKYSFTATGTMVSRVSSH